VNGSPAIEEAARFSSYSEAQVACSALRAAGFDAVLLDTDAVIGAWREPYGSGGYRIGAPQDQVVAVRAMLRQAEAQDQARPDRPLTRSSAPKLDRLSLARLILIAALFLAIAAAALLHHQ
jgi:hypothetical protein